MGNWRCTSARLLENYIFRWELKSIVQLME